MSSPGAPPETGYLEDQAAPPETGPGFEGLPDITQGAPRPDDRYPASFEPQQEVRRGQSLPSLSQTEGDPNVDPLAQPIPQAVPGQKPVRSALFNPTPVEQMQPRMRPKAIDPSLLDPRAEEDIPPVLRGGIPDEKRIPMPVQGGPMRANYMRGQHGAPGENLVPIELPNGRTLSVHREAAPSFQGFLDDLANAGAPLNSVGGHSHRNIAGTGKLSQHAYGNAIDINQVGRDRVSPAFRRWAQENDNVIRAAEAKWGLISGGDWKNPDFGHWEWAGRRGGQVARQPGVPPTKVQTETIKGSVPYLQFDDNVQKFVPTDMPAPAGVQFDPAQQKFVPIPRPRPDEAPDPTWPDENPANPNDPTPTTVAAATQTMQSPAQELDSLSQTKPWVTPNQNRAPWKALRQPFPMTHPIPSQSFELPPDLDPTQKEGDPLDNLEALNRLEPTFEQPLYVKGEPIYRGPTSTAADAEEPNFSPAKYNLTFNPPELPKNFDILKEPMPISPESIPDNQKALSTMDQLSRPTRFAIKGALDAIPNMGYSLGAWGSGVLATPGRIIAPGSPSAADKAEDWFLRRREESSKTTSKLMGLDNVPEPQNFSEKMGQITGESLSPAGKVTVPLSVGVFGVNTLFGPSSPMNFFNWYFGDANAASAKKPKKEKATDVTQDFEPAVPGHSEPGNLDVGALRTEISATKYTDDEGNVVLIPNGSIYVQPGRGPMNLTPELAILQYKRTGLNFGKFSDEEAADNYLKIMNDKVVTQVQTIGGPAEFKRSDLIPMTAMVAATVGVMFAPSLIKTFTNGKVFQPTPGRFVENAAPGTRAYSTRYELARVYDDINAVPSLVGKRMGMNANDVIELEKTWSTQTRGAASNLASSAIENGVAQTPAFRFKVNTSLQKLNNVVDEPTTLYVSNLNALQEIGKIERRIQASSPAQQAAQPGPPQWKGQDRQYYEQQNQAIIQSNPEVRMHAGVVRENIKEMRRVMEDGEFGTMTRDERNRLNREEVHGINYGRNDPNHANPAVALSDELRTNLRARLENESKGITIDMMNAHRPGSFVRVSNEELRQNPHWKENVVEIKRRGEIERYTTDPLLATIMKMDPYYAKSWAGEVLSGTKRLFESTTTGFLAPAFAPVSMLRSHFIIKDTAARLGWQAPNIGETLMAIPQQLSPKMQMFLARSIDQQFGNWAGQNLGKYASPWLQGLGRRMEATYKNSLDVKLQGAGARYGTILQQQERSNAALNSAITNATGPLKVFLSGWKHTFEAVHNAPAYATAKKNFGRVTREDLALETRRLTGDPQAGGEYRIGGKKIPFHHSQGQGFIQNLIERGMTKGVQLYGASTEAGRTMIPWYNVTVQGAKRIGRAYAQDPLRFVAGLYVSQAMPAAAAYLWNRSLGKDPQGIPYTEYMMNHRSPYNTMLNHYIGIPGKPASQGIELPGKYHETAMVGRWMEIALDHMFRSNQYSFSRDFRDAAHNAVGVVTSIPMPPLLNAYLGTQGIPGPQGLFEGDLYKKKNFAFDQNVGLPVNIELVMRAFGGGLADMFGSGINAMIQAEGWHKPGAFVSQTVGKFAERTPIVRNVTGMVPKQPGNTRVIKEMHERQAEFKMLDEYAKNFGLEGGPIAISAKPASKAGGMLADEKLGRAPPTLSPGLPQPKPENPMYREAMGMVHDALAKDDPSKGGIGQRSLWQRYSRATKVLNTMKHISAGNIATWQQRMDTPEYAEVKEYLQHNRVDTKDPMAVASFYEQQRQNTAREIMLNFDKVEAQLSAKYGKKVKIRDLDPYKKPTTMPEWIAKGDVLEHLLGSSLTDY